MPSIFQGPQRREDIPIERVFDSFSRPEETLGERPLFYKPKPGETLLLYLAISVDDVSSVLEL